MIEIEISGLTLVDTPMDMLLDARAALESEILSRAAEELMRIEKRKQTLEQLLGSSDRVLDAPEIKPRKSRKSVNAPKFYNPENPEQTWTGRGKAPDWFKKGNRVFHVEPENPAGFAPADLIPCSQNPDCNNTDSLALALQ